MLKRSEYFQGVECPFREICRRPYCHFRHRGRGNPNTKDGEARDGSEYDPGSPELPPAAVCSGDNLSEADQEILNEALELEKVNKAIEEVKNEVEREQRKYDKLLEIQKCIPRRSAKSGGPSSIEYSPVGSGKNSLSYNPTQLSSLNKPCKYSLSDHKNETKKKSKCMEYVPTSVSKCKIAKKYVIDNSKPSTDMEYDPMSNYSARLLNKTAHKVPKKHKDRQDEDCAPYAKKVCRQPSNLLAEDSGRDSDSCFSLNDTSLTETKEKHAHTVYDVPAHSKVDLVKQKKSKSKDPAKKTSHIHLKNAKKDSVTEASVCKGPNEDEHSLPKKSKIADVRNIKKSKNDKKARKDTALEDSALKTKELGKAKRDKAPKQAVESNGEKHKVNTKSESKITAKRTLKGETKRRSLSHVDLFGNDSSDDEKKLDSPILETNCDSDPDQMEECLRIFNEFQDVKTEDKGRAGRQKNEEITEKSGELVLTPSQKKRISHVKHSNHSDSSGKQVERQNCRPTPQEMCYRRIQKAQEQAENLKRNTQKLPLSLSRDVACVPASTPSTTFQTLFQERKSQLSSSPLVLKTETLSGMASKTTSTTVQKRQAHIPSLKSAALKRPVIPTEYGTKVPTSMRQRYLNIFIDECLKCCASEKEAFAKALEEEKLVYSRSNSRNIYLNVAVNTLKKLRSQGTVSKSPKVANKNAVSHKSNLDGKLATKTSFTVQTKVRPEEDGSDATLYKTMKTYMLTPEQLKEHGYPLAHPETPGKAIVFKAEEKKSSSVSCRICCRCGIEYMVTQSGISIRQEECVYHWGRLRRQRVSGGWETQYACCSGGVGTSGCQIAKQHVYDGRKENLDGFVKTFEKLNDFESPGVYALDCEMCYTTKGLELTRITVINSKLNVVYDTFVQPDNKILDYNTRFSGVTEEDLETTKITIRDVQAVLLCMFSFDTILLGHSLESDLLALKLIHLTVVDTAIVFPHRLGLPYKRALRSLMADHLKRIIQDSVEGHDSSEDACACMELMLWRIKEDAKVK